MNPLSGQAAYVSYWRMIADGKVLIADDKCSQFNRFVLLLLLVQVNRWPDCHCLLYNWNVC